MQDHEHPGHVSTGASTIARGASARACFFSVRAGTPTTDRRVASSNTMPRVRPTRDTMGSERVIVFSEVGRLARNPSRYRTETAPRIDRQPRKECMPPSARALEHAIFAYLRSPQLCAQTSAALYGFAAGPTGRPHKSYGAGRGGLLLAVGPGSILRVAVSRRLQGAIMDDRVTEKKEPDEGDSLARLQVSFAGKLAPH